MCQYKTEQNNIFSYLIILFLRKMKRIISVIAGLKLCRLFGSEVNYLEVLIPSYSPCPNNYLSPNKIVGLVSKENRLPEIIFNNENAPTPTRMQSYVCLPSVSIYNFNDKIAQNILDIY